jgi:pectin methylesterase-like acyl-CoA thioesterase
VVRHITLLLVVSVASISWGRVITVDDDGPADFSTIQAAIDDAVDGDVVEVKPGTYTGEGNRDIDYKGKGITVTL